MIETRRSFCRVCHASCPIDVDVEVVASLWADPGLAAPKLTHGVLQVRPGEDPTLLAGMINVVLTEDLADHEFCDEWVGDLGLLAAHVASFTPQYVAARCGIDVDDFLRAIRMFAGGTRGTAGTGAGPNMAPHSSLSEHLVIVLNTILGRVNRTGDRLESGWFLYPETPRRAQVIPARPPVTGAPSRIRDLRGYRSEMPTATLAEEILQEGDGQIRALIVSGGNPAVAWPRSANPPSCSQPAPARVT